MAETMQDIFLKTESEPTFRPAALRRNLGSAKLLDQVLLLA